MQCTYQNLFISETKQRGPSQHVHNGRIFHLVRGRLQFASLRLLRRRRTRARTSVRRVQRTHSAGPGTPVNTGTDRTLDRQAIYSRGRDYCCHTLRGITAE